MSYFFCSISIIYSYIYMYIDAVKFNSIVKKMALLGHGDGRS